MFRLRLTCLLFLFGGLLCLSSMVNSEEEDFTDGGPLDLFLTELEIHSGLNTLPPEKTVSVACSELALTECIVNYNGTIVWNVREQLYEEHMMQNFETEAEKRTTLNGCVQYNSNDTDSYIACMKEVRESMRTFLSEEFDDRFKTELESDCSLYIDNCVQDGI